MVGTNSLEKLTEIDANGRTVKCPSCSTMHQVHYFSWTGVTCNTCMRNISTYKWSDIN